MKKQKPNIEPESPFGLKNDWREHPMPEREKVKAGPNRWAMVKDVPMAYGKNFDFRVMDGDVFMPACVAAQEWIRSKVGETQHWYSDLDGWMGVVVDETVLRAAERDGLINEYDYAMEMEERDRRAGE